MATINKTFALQVLEENFKNYQQNGEDTTTTLRQYVEACAESEPNFYRWLFKDDEISDFGDNLTDEQRDEYNDFLDTCE